MVWSVLMILTATAAVSAGPERCTYDDTNPVPTGVGTDFCSSFITEHCAGVTGLDPGKVTTYCECLLASATGTASLAVNSTMTTTASVSASGQIRPGQSSTVETTSLVTSSTLTVVTLSLGNGTVSSTTSTQKSTKTPVIQSDQSSGHGEPQSTGDSQSFSAASDSSQSTQTGRTTASVFGSESTLSHSRTLQPTISFINETISSVSTGNGSTESILSSSSNTLTAVRSDHSEVWSNSSALVSKSSSTRSGISSSGVSVESVPLTPALTTGSSLDLSATSTGSVSEEGNLSANNSSSSTSVSNITTTIPSSRPSTPSDAAGSATQPPVSIPWDITVFPGASTASRFTSFNASEKPTFVSPNSSSTTSSWNATLPKPPNSSGAANPTLSAPGDLTANDTTSINTVLVATSRHGTGDSSGTLSAQPSTEILTFVTQNITGSATTMAISVPSPFTTPIFASPSSTNVGWDATAPPPNSTVSSSTFSAANFTSISQTAAIAGETCYQLAPSPQGDSPRRALMRNARLREQNVSIPSLYIESIDFDSDGISPLYLTLRDTTQSTHHLDVSNKSQIAITDADGATMKLDAQGIYFSSHDCLYGISIKAMDLLQQVASLSGVECSTGVGVEKRLFDIPFSQVLNLRDQCGNPVGRSLRSYPRLSVGSSECTDLSVDEDTGSWDFACMFPGSESSTLQCQSTVKNDVIDYLTTDPFGGACADVSTVITTLTTTGTDFLSNSSLRAELFKKGLSDEEKTEASTVLESFQRMWRVLRETFVKDSTGASALGTYLAVYNKHRDFLADVCEDIHVDEIPLNLTLRAGASRFVITTLNFAPDVTQSHDVTVQDSAKEACCDNGSVASGGGTNGTCSYPASAFIQNSGCICGKTTSGDSVAFEYTECDNFVSICDVDQDCSDGGHSGFVCVTGTCCGGGVCIDPYACSENGTQLVTFDAHLD